MFELYPDQRAEGEVRVDGENILTSKEDVALVRAKIGMSRIEGVLSGAAPIAPQGLVVRRQSALAPGEIAKRQN